MYVSDLDYRGIIKLDSNGTFITKWGRLGSGDGEFYIPRGIAVDSKTGNVYVVDDGNGRIEKFSSNGTLIAILSVNVRNAYGYGWLEDVAIDSKTGNVYALDRYAGLINVFAPKAN